MDGFVTIPMTQFTEGTRELMLRLGTIMVNGRTYVTTMCILRYIQLRAKPQHPAER